MSHENVVKEKENRPRTWPRMRERLDALDHAAWERTCFYYRMLVHGAGERLPDPEIQPNRVLRTLDRWNLLVEPIFRFLRQNFDGRYVYRGRAFQSKVRRVRSGYEAAFDNFLFDQGVRSGYERKLKFERRGRLNIVPEGKRVLNLFWHDQYRKSWQQAKAMWHRTKKDWQPVYELLRQGKLISAYRKNREVFHFWGRIKIKPDFALYLINTDGKPFMPIVEIFGRTKDPEYDRQKEAKLKLYRSVGLPCVTVYPHWRVNDKLVPDIKQAENSAGKPVWPRTKQCYPQVFPVLFTKATGQQWQGMRKPSRLAIFWHRLRSRWPKCFEFPLDN